MAATAVFAAIPATVRLVTPGRRRLHANVGASACRAWGRTLCAILNIRREVAGTLPAEGVFLVAANHLSYVDILVLGSLYRSVFLAKREIASWPLFGWIARGAGTLFVDRDQPKDIVRAAREMSERLDLGVSLTIFPEGRSTRGTEILPFQAPLLEPAARAGIPCWSASISYDTPGTAVAPSATVCWYDSQNFPRHFLRLAGVSHVVAHVRFAEDPVVSKDRKVLARELWEQTASTFVPVRQT